jgi:hypothetical protein
VSPRVLQRFAEVDASVDYLKAERLMSLLRERVIDPGVGGNFEASMTARPILGGAHEGFADAAFAKGLVDEPAFDEADGMYGITAIGVGTKPYLEKSC